VVEDVTVKHPHSGPFVETNGEAQRAAAGFWGEKQVMAGVVAQIEYALPVSASIPINPAGEAPIGAVPDAGRKLQIIRGTIESDGLAPASVLSGLARLAFPYGTGYPGRPLACRIGVKGVRNEWVICYRLGVLRIRVRQPMAAPCQFGERSRLASAGHPGDQDLGHPEQASPTDTA